MGLWVSSDAQARAKHDDHVREMENKRLDQENDQKAREHEMALKERDIELARHKEEIELLKVKLDHEEKLKTHAMNQGVALVNELRKDGCQPEDLDRLLKVLQGLVENTYITSGLHSIEMGPNRITSVIQRR